MAFGRSLGTQLVSEMKTPFIPKEWSWEVAPSPWWLFLHAKFGWIIHLNTTDIPSLQLTVCTWKFVVGIPVSFWESLFSSAILVSGRLQPFLGITMSLIQLFPYIAMIPQMHLQLASVTEHANADVYDQDFTQCFRKFMLSFPCSQTTHLFGHKPFHDVCAFSKFQQKESTLASLFGSWRFSELQTNKNWRSQSMLWLKKIPPPKKKTTITYPLKIDAWKMIPFLPKIVPLRFHLVSRSLWFLGWPWFFPQTPWQRCRSVSVKWRENDERQRVQTAGMFWGGFLG